MLLLSFDPLRAIVLVNRLPLVLVPDGAGSIIGSLAKRVRCGLAEEEDSVFGSERSSSERQQTSSETGTPGTPKGSNQKLNNPDDDVPNETSGAGDRPVLAPSLAYRTLQAGSKAFGSFGSNEDRYKCADSNADVASGAKGVQDEDANGFSSANRSDDGSDDE
eukprot:CAMPEP_0194030864 /NCGR_PEP_ID=MMETSP0009_2-20130614/4190_1 /TAXON_ID=210454 /ORGANISM="Grammatophora oceanica, Strain CCMP 410" /LENGTH=162 /DNA_ID=CAMNT_0038670879 /DNA_START=146 /DNA_END=632 /DNA_ORIENTATION=+